MMKKRQEQYEALHKGFIFGTRAQLRALVADEGASALTEDGSTSRAMREFVATVEEDKKEEAALQSRAHQWWLNPDVL